MVISNQEKVVTLLTSIETGDPKPVSYINPDKYIQHNLMVGDIYPNSGGPSLSLGIIISIFATLRFRNEPEVKLFPVCSITVALVTTINCLDLFI